MSSWFLLCMVLRGRITLGFRHVLAARHRQRGLQVAPGRAALLGTRQRSIGLQDLSGRALLAGIRAVTHRISFNEWPLRLHSIRNSARNMRAWSSLNTSRTIFVPRSPSASLANMKAFRRFPSPCL